MGYLKGQDYSDLIKLKVILREKSKMTYTITGSMGLD